MQQGLLQKIIFPGGWALSAVIVCGLRVFTPYAASYVFVCGVICYLVAWLIRSAFCIESRRAMRLSTRDKQDECNSYRDARFNPKQLPKQLLRVFVPILKVLAAIALIFLSSEVAIRAYGVATWNPIGATYDNGRGSEPCEKGELVVVTNGAGEVASTHRSICQTGPWVGDQYFSYFVFVHKVGENETARNLVFRYEPTATGWVTPPKLVWKSNSTLLISVGKGNIKRVTKERTILGPFLIHFILAPSEKPPLTHLWERPF